MQVHSLMASVRFGGGRWRLSVGIRRSGGRMDFRRSGGLEGGERRFSLPYWALYLVTPTYRSRKTCLWDRSRVAVLDDVAVEARCCFVFHIESYVWRRL